MRRRRAARRRGGTASPTRSTARREEATMPGLTRVLRTRQCSDLKGDHRGTRRNDSFQLLQTRLFNKGYIFKLDLSSDESQLQGVSETLSR